MDRLNVGDLVQLKAGGPIMTIASVMEENSPSPALKFNFFANKAKYPEATYLYVCTWFIKDEAGNDVCKEHLFPDHVLSKV